MGIGPISSIYQARFMRYLQNRGLAQTETVTCGESSGTAKWTTGVSGGPHACRAERLDNLTFVINCNLQRLDGPVRGNGQIIRNWKVYSPAPGWNVIKVYGDPIGLPVRTRPESFV